MTNTTPIDSTEPAATTTPTNRQKMPVGEKRFYVAMVIAATLVLAGIACRVAYVAGATHERNQALESLKPAQVIAKNDANTWNGIPLQPAITATYCGIAMLVDGTNVMRTDSGIYIMHGYWPSIIAKPDTQMQLRYYDVVFTEPTGNRLVVHTLVHYEALPAGEQTKGTCPTS